MRACTTRSSSVASDNGYQCNNVAGSSVNFLPLEDSTSKICKYFGFPARDGVFLEADKRKRKEVTCKMCFKIVVNTLNMNQCDSIHYREQCQLWYRDSKIFTIAQPYTVPSLTFTA